jgi:hypothetical protein
VQYEVRQKVLLNVIIFIMHEGLPPKLISKIYGSVSDCKTSVQGCLEVGVTARDQSASDYLSHSKKIPSGPIASK